MFQRLPVAVLLATVLAACSGSTTPADTPATGRATTTDQASADATSTAIPEVPTTKVLTVVLENHGLQTALEQMPALAALAEAHGTATAYGNLTHPSLPNYLAMAGGSSFGVTDNEGPDTHPLSGPSVFSLGDAKVYADAMTEPCQVRDDGTYRVKHNPWPYFVDERAACAQRDVPLTTLAADVDGGALPTVGLVIPDMCHDGHDCPLSDADPWLKDLLDSVLAGPDYQSGRLAVVVTFDEDEKGGQGAILTAVIAPRLSGVTVDAPLDHLAWNRWMTDLLGVDPLRDAATAPSLGAAFGLA